MKIRKQTDEKLSASKLLKIQKDLAVDVVLMSEMYTPSTHLLVIFVSLTQSRVTGDKVKLNFEIISILLASYHIGEMLSELFLDSVKYQHIWFHF